MKITAKSRYALRTLLDIAISGADKPRTIAEIASSQAISEKFISRIVVPLRRAGLLESERGARGGLRLARSPGDITLLDISEALDGPTSILKCLAEPKICRRHARCPARTVWDDINTTLKNALASVTLSSVMSRQ